ncbi:MAG TPA: phosphate ABC transporter permease subunit PstC [Alphaproteobacteria bacterium]|nr:phosphate ABC transporter permease subunit PstC [Alphaproteobacteria bacterium]
MSDVLFLFVVIFLAIVFYRWGSQKAIRLQKNKTHPLTARPAYHGLYLATWAIIAALLSLFLSNAILPWLMYKKIQATLPSGFLESSGLSLDTLILRIEQSLEKSASNLSEILSADLLEKLQATLQTWLNIQLFLPPMIMLIAAGLTSLITKRCINSHFKARTIVEKYTQRLLAVCASVAVAITIGIVASLVLEAWRFFERVPISDFVFGLEWSPQTALRADQTGSSASFGVIPVILGTFMIMIIAVGIAAPFGLMSAIYMTEYLSPRYRSLVKPILELLAGIPTVVYGYFAAIIVAPLLRDIGNWLGIDVAAESALAAALVMGMMIIPFVASLSDDALKAVPSSLRDGSYALGATKSETICKVLVPAALPGIIGGVLLAISRAIGETMIVVMAAGLAANLTINPLDSVTTVTVQITTLLTGDQEFNSSKTLAAFALGLILFLITLVLNIISLWILARYRQKYD